MARLKVNESKVNESKVNKVKANRVKANRMNANRMKAPASGVTVRMYRQGLGDCFLLAFPTDQPDQPFYMLIDCGVIVGTPEPATIMTEVAKSIQEATGGEIHLLVATHEHWDHLSGFLQAEEIFEQMKIHQVWFAWTEDPANPHAKKVKAELHKQRQALSLVLQKAVHSDSMAPINALLEFFGDPSALGAGGRQTTGDALRAVEKFVAQTGGAPQYRQPGEGPLTLPPVGELSVPGARVYILGPPYDTRLLKRTNPSRQEGYEEEGQHGVAALAAALALELTRSASPGASYKETLKAVLPKWIEGEGSIPRSEARSSGIKPTPQAVEEVAPAAGLNAGKAFLLAALPEEQDLVDPELRELSFPFEARLRLPKREAAEYTVTTADGGQKRFFETFYGLGHFQELQQSKPGNEGAGPSRPPAGPAPESPHESAWRRIDDDWLGSAGEFALQLDSYTNNTSLAMAIELKATGKVLMFVADAQAGNWMSWGDLSWTVGEGEAARTVTIADLFANTVLYKVGHHGSHNATMSTQGLELMTSDDLVAMLPVDEQVAHEIKKWKRMPFEPITARLAEKTKGRLMRVDRSLPEQKHKKLSKAGWEQFQNNVREDDLYFEYTIPD